MKKPGGMGGTGSGSTTRSKTPASTAAKAGSGSGVTPSVKAGSSSGVSPAIKPGSARAPNRPSSAAPSDLAARREALGLSSMKPSEMVAGLDAAAQRAEKAEQREQAKRKGGGHNLNTALHVDDTGRRWSRIVILTLLGLTIFIGGSVALAIYISNHKSIPVERGNQETRQELRDLGLIAGQLKGFDPDEKLNVDKVKERLTAAINAQIEEVKARIKSQEDVHRPPGSRDIEEKEELNTLLKYEDPWGQPFQLTVGDDDKLTISAKGKPEFGHPIDPVVVKLRRNKPSK
jgi:hypothetical protein